MQKWCKLRSGVLFAFTKTMPQGAVLCDAEGAPLADQPVQPADGSGQAEPGALVDQESTQPAQVGDLPDGPVLAIVEWVGNDAGRAAQALEAENKRARPRKSVTTALAHVGDTTEGG